MFNHMSGLGFASDIDPQPGRVFISEAAKRAAGVSDQTLKRHTEHFLKLDAMLKSGQTLTANQKALYKKLGAEIGADTSRLAMSAPIPVNASTTGAGSMGFSLSPAVLVAAGVLALVMFAGKKR